MTLPPMARFLPELMRLKPMATCIFGGTILANYFRLVRPLSMLGGAACLVPAQVLGGLQIWRCPRPPGAVKRP
jgi:hypothetical protein